MTNRISTRLRDRKNSEILGGEMRSDGFGNGQPRDAQDARIKALEDIAMQPTSEEWEDEGDTKFGYDSIILKARAALAAAKENEDE